VLHKHGTAAKRTVESNFENLRAANKSNAIIGKDARIEIGEENSLAESECDVFELKQQRIRGAVSAGPRRRV
jgi:hypothetical protein